MKRLTKIGMILLGMVFGIASIVHADTDPVDPASKLLKSCMANAKTGCSNWVKEGGSEGFPRGLTSETTAELAAGETYILSGKIQIISGQHVFLKVDLVEFPWLASAARKAFPLYRIDDSVSRWIKHDGKYLSILATARIAIWADNKNRYTSETYLEPTAQPVLEFGSATKYGKSRAAKESCQ
jgi:hypothetical protein